MEKCCFKCGETKPLDAFYKHPMMADGRLNKCKDCAKIDVRKHRIENPEKVREYDRQRARRPERASERVERLRRERALFPERDKARQAVAYAVRTGVLHKLPCAFCGATERLEAHHHDYSKPLDVTWLCSACHSRYHALESMAAYRDAA